MERDRPEIETPRLKHIIEVGNHTIPFSRPDEGLFVIDFLAHEYLKHPRRRSSG